METKELLNHDIVYLKEDYSKAGVPVGSVGVIVYKYPQKETYEVEFEKDNGEIVVLTLQSNQIEFKPISDRDAKREWRKQAQFEIKRNCCFNCRMSSHQKADGMLTYCIKMSQDLGISLTQCQTYMTYVCKYFIEKE